MGKVKETSPAQKSAASPKPAGAGDTKRQFALFLANLFQSSAYKPLQGKRARLWTAVGIGATILLGLRELLMTLDGAQFSPAVFYGVPVALGFVFAWVTYRLLQFPPFVDFLIATEAEMNKVSWTSKDDLKRATMVVLFTVAFMAIFLFGVDWLWSNLLQLIGRAPVQRHERFGIVRLSLLRLDLGNSPLVIGPHERSRRK